MFSSPSQVREKWRAFVNMVINRQISLNVGNFLTSWSFRMEEERENWGTVAHQQKLRLVLLQNVVIVYLFK
jgi:hypothetical protein